MYIRKQQLDAFNRLVAANSRVIAATMSAMAVAIGVYLLSQTISITAGWAAAIAVGTAIAVWPIAFAIFSRRQRS